MSCTITLTSDVLDRLAAQLVDDAEACADARLILGIAGIPGSGKSALANLVGERINARRSGLAGLAPMDGFHLPNTVLVERGLLDRKGAPATFDADAYARMLERCRDPSAEIICPRYDRAVHEPVSGDDPLHRVVSTTRIVITEGNYLLLDQAPWSRIGGILTQSWLLDTPMETARRWIMQRHAEVGRSPEEAERRYVNDLANTRLVLVHSRAADHVVAWPED